MSGIKDLGDLGGRVLRRARWVLKPDPDVSGRQYALTVLSPILPGRTDALRERLEALPPGPESPFARVPELHFCRLVILPQLVWEGRGHPTEELRNQYLLFTSCSTGSLDDHVESLRSGLGPDADAIWSDCVGYPGIDGAGFGAWIRSCQIKTSLFHAGYPNASVSDVRDSVALRDDLVAYALAARRMDPATAHARYLEAFCS